MNITALLDFTTIGGTVLMSYKKSCSRRDGSFFDKLSLKQWLVIINFLVGATVSCFQSGRRGESQ